MIEAQEEKAKKPKTGKEKEKKEHKPAVAHKPSVDSGVAQLVRVAGVVVNGNLDLVRAVMKVKGVGPRVSRALAPSLGIPPKTKIGSLNDVQINEIEDKLNNMHKYLPSWMVNRRKDKLTGNNLHLIGPTLDMQVREDINIEKKIRSYRGVRHSLGLPVRGQRTRSSFRTGGTLGVSRKKTAAVAAKPAESKEAKK
ncbi:MAG: 30S ribosomal protein S13 [Candidatus Altiarchaeota archaeon]|nr:30S ribosomal protein S13 [Candidatus Altiarchaeota archaeon]